VPSIEFEAGTRVDQQQMQLSHEPPPNVQIVDQSGPRIVFQFNNQLVIVNQADTRLDYGASERYVEQLPRGRIRETIVRPDGSELVTIYNRYGDIVQRSRITPDGREIILAYAPYSYEEDVHDWYDPGQDLPPLHFDYLPEDYVLDADTASLDDLTGFLYAPPVEQVPRLYSIGEVKRSARVRDMVRRLEIGNLTFESGSSAIPADQIGALSIVANGMLDLIDENPGETFLIEGHTDAVGSDYANLILSDRRAESVAIALTEVYGVPPENIATQGYGERYLKVMTEASERANRRVAVRRITALVAPVDMAAN
jgi:outer membrane protein OmpA-like peptidoglycan-associated protein